MEHPVAGKAHRETAMNICFGSYLADVHSFPASADSVNRDKGNLLLDRLTSNTKKVKSKR